MFSFVPASSKHPSDLWKSPKIWRESDSPQVTYWYPLKRSRINQPQPYFKGSRAEEPGACLYIGDFSCRASNMLGETTSRLWTPISVVKLHSSSLNIIKYYNSLRDVVLDGFQDGCQKHGFLDMFERKLGGGFKHFLISPLPEEMIQFDERIFQMGWNHQLESMLDWVLSGVKLLKSFKNSLLGCPWKLVTS